MLDTRDKRGSAVHVYLPWRAELPTPSGTVDTAARAILALLASSIPAGAAAVSGVNTALKRMAAVHLMCPWRRIIPFPDGTVGSEDRPVMALLYSRASNAPPAPADGEHHSMPFFATPGQLKSW